MAYQVQLLSGRSVKTFHEDDEALLTHLEVLLKIHPAGDYPKAAALIYLTGQLTGTGPVLASISLAVESPTLAKI